MDCSLTACIDDMNISDWDDQREERHVDEQERAFLTLTYKVLRLWSWAPSI